MRANHVAVLVVCALSTLAMGCAKTKPLTPAQEQGNALTSLSLALQLPVPDNSYSTTSKSGVAATTNLGMVISSYIDPIAGALKESNSNFAHTVSKGVPNDDATHYVYSPPNAELFVTRNTTAKTASLTFNVGAYKPYFTGTVSLDATTGHLEIPASALTEKSTADFTIGAAKGGAGLVRTVTILNTVRGTVGFTTNLDSTGKVTLITFSYVNGASTAKGFWGAKGGNVTDATGTSRCWDQSLNDTSACPTEQSVQGVAGTTP